jgi:hypothetical protein
MNSRRWLLAPIKVAVDLDMRPNRQEISGSNQKSVFESTRSFKMFVRVSKFVVLLCVMIMGALATSAAATTLWDEAMNGDLSGNGLTPTSVVLGPGTNSLLGSSVAGDLDYLSVKVLPGEEFLALTLSSYSSQDAMAFIAIQSGPTFTAAPPLPPVSNLLGYTHFGPGAGFFAGVGSDLFFPLATSAGAIGFSAPLPSGDYTFWIQQTGAQTSYRFEFLATPEPTAVVLFACGLVGMAAVARRRNDPSNGWK